MEALPSETVVEDSSWKLSRPKLSLQNPPESFRILQTPSESFGILQSPPETARIFSESSTIVRCHQKPFRSSEPFRILQGLPSEFPCPCPLLGCFAVVIVDRPKWSRLASRVSEVRFLAELGPTFAVRQRYQNSPPQLPQRSATE